MTPPNAPTAAEEYVIVACHDCGLAYGSEGWIECMLPAETWSEISPTHDAGGILCITCIARRLKRAGGERVPVMLCGTEAIIAAGQDEAFERGWRVAEKRIAELDCLRATAERQRDRLRETLQFIHDTLGYVEATSAGAVLRSIEYASRHALAFPNAPEEIGGGSLPGAC